MMTNYKHEKVDRKAIMENAEAKESPELLWHELTAQELEVVRGGDVLQSGNNTVLDATLTSLKDVAFSIVPGFQALSAVLGFPSSYSN
jgi:hypothetical protein